MIEIAVTVGSEGPEVTKYDEKRNDKNKLEDLCILMKELRLSTKAK